MLVKHVEVVPYVCVCVCAQLFYHLQREGCFPEPRAAFYAAEMATALGYLHSLNIVYRWAYLQRFRQKTMRSIPNKWERKEWQSNGK